MKLKEFYYYKARSNNSRYEYAAVNLWNVLLIAVCQ